MNPRLSTFTPAASSPMFFECGRMPTATSSTSQTILLALPFTSIFQRDRAVRLLLVPHGLRVHEDLPAALRHLALDKLAQSGSVPVRIYGERLHDGQLAAERLVDHPELQVPGYTPPPMTQRRFGTWRRLTASFRTNHLLPWKLQRRQLDRRRPHFAMTIPFVAVIVSVSPDGSFTLTVVGLVIVASPIISSAPFVLSSARTPVVSFLTMPSFQSCITFASCSMKPYLMPSSSPPSAAICDVVRRADERLRRDAPPVEADASGSAFSMQRVFCLSCPKAGIAQG